MTAPARVALRSVAAGYGGRTVVSGIDAAAPAGSWLAIIGPNGAGKSTLLKAIVGLLPHHGRIRIGERELAELPHRERARTLGYAPQAPTLPGGLTVTDYALLGRTPHLRPLARESGADRELVAAVLARLDLARLANRPLRTLSGGERQRAVLARVLAAQTGVLLLDEPTTGLDVGHAQALLERLDGLRVTDGTTVVTTLHDLTLAAQYADQVLLLDAGRMVAVGPPEDVLTAGRLATHYAADVEVLANGCGQQVIAPVRRGPRNGHARPAEPDRSQPGGLR